MALGKVLSRGQVTLPREIRRAAGIQPGDTVTLRVSGAGRIEIRVLPRLRLAEALARYRVEGPVDDRVDRARWQAEAAGDVLGRSEAKDD